jgi:hypothetical protein
VNLRLVDRDAHLTSPENKISRWLWLDKNKISRSAGFCFAESKISRSVRIPQQDSAERRAFNKIARTFAAQVETLKRNNHNDKGQEKLQVCDIIWKTRIEDVPNRHDANEN